MFGIWKKLTASSNSDGVPQSSGSSGCDGWKPTDVDIASTLSSGDATQSFVCGPGTNLQPYWINTINDGRQTGCNPARGDCGTVSFGKLPGIAKLGGSGLDGDWGGLTRDDLVQR